MRDRLNCPCSRCIYFLLFVYVTMLYQSFVSFFFYVSRYAIGGLAGGEDKDSFWRVVAQCTAGLPENKPRYVMVYTFFLSLKHDVMVYTVSLNFLM